MGNKEWARTYRQKHPDRVRETERRFEERHPGWRLEKQRLQRLRIRTEVLSHYSGGGEPHCVCCGESQIEFLCIDHINGGGEKHRQEIAPRGGTAIYRWLRRNNYPEGFRTLCHNCNHALGSYGYCPHHPEVKA